MKHYLIKSVESVTIYKTPVAILEFIQKEIILKNPPYDTKK